MTDDSQTHPASPQKMDGRWLVVAILLGYGVLLSVLIHFFGYHQGWLCVGVPSLQPVFADLHVVTAGVDSLRAGFDPLQINPADAWFRPMNYPRAWLALMLAFDIHQGQTFVLGLVLAVAFLGSVLLFMGRVDGWQGAYWGLLLCTPAITLAVERGNTDLVVFVLLALTLLALRRDIVRPWAAYLVVFACAILKLYPIGAFMLAWREKPRRALTILTLAGLAFAVYLYATRQDLQFIRKSTPHPYGVSYGCQVLFDWLAGGKKLTGILAAMPVLTTLAAVSTAAWARTRLPRPTPLPRADADGLMVGGAMYAVTFILNINFNYRLVVLLFTVPALLRLHRSEPVFYQRLGSLLLASIGVGWLLSQMPLREAFLIKEAANWIVFAGTVFLLFQFLPWPARRGAVGAPRLRQTKRSEIEAVPIREFSVRT